MKSDSLRKNLIKVIKRICVAVLVVFACLIAVGVGQRYRIGEMTVLRAFDTDSNAAPISQEFTLLESEGGTYFGSVIDLVYAGNGEFQHLDGGVYEGEFKQSKREGTGSFTWMNGDRFTGIWTGDNMVSGTYSFADGRKYIGTFDNNRIDTGTYSISKSEKHPEIISFEAQITSKVVAELTIKLADGSTYSGQLNGKANIHYPSGNEYSGEVINGKRSGSGTFKWITDSTLIARYEGSWENGVMSGEGTYYYTNGDFPNLKGTFVAGKPDGELTYTKEANNTFSTSWNSGTCKSVKEK